ncbi:MAG: type II toxin-antitoxin system HicA family toxin [Clostridia bacterium]|nr:type II toxin-antitoxin system HicA family toxin [Clostridia bacterium]
MSKHEKTKQKILSTPTANDFTPKEIQNFLDKYGFILKHVNGSHFIYAYPNGDREFMLNIPMHNPVKPSYIDKIRKCIREIEGE